MNDLKLLIVEDDPGLQSQLRWCFDTSITVLTAGDAATALKELDEHQLQVVTLDLGLPPDAGGTSEGFKLLAELTARTPAPKVIVITGREEREHALKAVASGAYDFYQKPIDADTLRFAVDRAFRLWHLEHENRRLAEATQDTPLPGLITGDPTMLQLCRQVERVAPTDATVAILGDTGTGKEVIARNIHELSTRAAAPFVAINCAAIPENLLESELFGYEKGAFTGASGRKVGKIEAANGGTLFLDEIGDMPPALQSKLLRFLQERSFERLGGNRLIEVDVRVLCATHQALDETSSGFREDLYFRLSEIVLRLPKLAERQGDAVLLAKHLLRRSSERKLYLTPEAVSAINAHPWPGNVRELENRIRRASILSDDNAISAQDLELASESSGAPVSSLKEARAAAEKLAVLSAMGEARNNISQAARLLEISRPTLYGLLNKYGLNPEENE